MAKQERSARTRRELIRTAATVFDQQGLTRATLVDICTQARVSTGALHFHFANKAALAAAVESEAAHALHEVVGIANLNGEPALQALTDASQRLAALLRTDVVVRAGFQLSHDYTREGALHLRRQWQGCVRSLLARAADEGALADGTPIPDTIAAIVAATTGFEVLSQDDQQWLSQPVITGFWRFILPRLTTPEALGRLDPGRVPAIPRARCLEDPAATAARSQPG